MATTRTMLPIPAAAAHSNCFDLMGTGLAGLAEVVSSVKLPLILQR
jgi:hypothetical protein